MKNEKKITDELTADVIRQFNESFRLHDISILDKLVAEDCVMEGAMPAPNGVRTVGKKDCIDFWQQLMSATDTLFSPEEVTIMGEKAIILWRYQWGDGEENSVRGVTIVTVKNGLIAEALGSVKAPGLTN
jgi:ketosteroid isomerase-like protein